MSPPENPSPAAPAEPPPAAAAKRKVKKKDKKKDEDLSEEDLALRKQLELYVVLAQDADPVVQKYALESMRKEICSATSSMTLVPKPLKFLRPHFGTLRAYFETMPESELKKYMADILSVLAIEGGESLKYRLLGSEGDIGSWGHEYVRMDPRQSNVGEVSQGQFSGGNIGAYQPGWNLYMYGYQPPPGWLPQGFQHRPPNVAMMNPSGYAPEGFQQAEIPEAYVHHSEADLEEVPAPTTKSGTKKSVTRIKLSNFNPDEDKNLVKSWLESRDPISSTGLKRDRMWERIIQRYNSRRASNPVRSLRSLQSRWDRIRAEVTQFASYFADSIRENPSGMSDADRTTYAVDNFAAVMRHKFGFLHCWELMKDAPEWQDPTARDIATATRGEGFGEESTAGTETVDHTESSPVRSQRFQQAEIPEAYVHHSEADLEEVPKTRTKKSVTRTKLSNFNPDEDKNLVKSWLEISRDPITSTGQKRDRMWERIIERYNSRRASNPARSLRSLQSRWDRIRAEVTLFASYYADSIRENPSGMSDADKTTYAVDNFTAVRRHKFGFLHCWELMKDAPKWQDPTAREIATAARGEGFVEESTAGTDTVDHTESSPVRSGAQARRPMGRDSAKAAKKKANSDAGSTSSAECAAGIPTFSAATEVTQRFQQAEIPEAYVHHSGADLEEVPTARTKKSVTRTKLGNFDLDEDKNLVKSWLEISRDPITSAGQKRDRMWDRIIERYNSRRASNPARSWRPLQSRWDRIRAEVTLFASYYADSIRENPSGMSDADKTTYAADNFAAVLQRKFGFLHCWELMKDAPEWQDPNARDIATAAQGEGFGEQSTAGTDTVDHAESSPVQSGAQARRPMGRDSAKAAKKKANSDAGSTSSAEYAAGMQDLSLQRISIMQEEAVRKNDRFQQLASIDEKRYEEMRRHNEALIQIEWEKIRLMRAKQDDERLKEEKKEDERILKIDLDACTPSLRLYYQTRQEEILEKIAARRRRSQAP